jgi:hypothetical protein
LAPSKDVPEGLGRLAAAGEEWGGWELACGRCGAGLLPGAPGGSVTTQVLVDLTGRKVADLLRPREPMSLLGLVRQRNIETLAGRCDECGAAFEWVRARVWPQMDRDAARAGGHDARSFRLDLGGYCATCRKHLCPAHLELKEFAREKDVLWVPCCRLCASVIGG